jgi:uncharacterized membrane protein
VSIAAITTYQAYLAVHIRTAVVWVGGALAVQLFAFRATRAVGGERLAAVAADAEWIGMRVFLPSSLILVVFGFLLMSEGNWEWEAWVVVALVVWGASALTGAAFLGPESGRVSRAIERHGIDSAEARARIKRIFLVSRVELVLLILIVLDMALKPGA